MKPVVNRNAQRILDTIDSTPGVHFRAVLRRTGITSAGQLRHHIDRLVNDGHIIETDDGGFRRYFAARRFDRRMRQDMTRLARPIPRRVARLLLTGSRPRHMIRKELGCPDSTLGYYLARMHAEGILEKHREANRQLYALADAGKARQILEAHGRPRSDLLEPEEAPDLFAARPATG